MTEPANINRSDSHVQNPQSLRWAIEQSIIELSSTSMDLENYLEFRRGGALIHVYQPFVSVFRFVVNITSSLQDINSQDKEVVKALAYLAPPENSITMWDSANTKEAEKRAREGLVLAQEYRAYLGTKGIISINR